VRAGVAGIVFCVITGTVATAYAQAPDEALTKEGVQLRRARRDAEALAVFSRALAIDGSPRTRAQIGLAEQALGLWVEAERDLSTALAEGAEIWFEQHREILESALASVREHLGSLKVETNVPGAEIWVDGERAGNAPLATPLRVVAGAVHLELRAPGFETQAQTSTVPVGSLTPVFLALERLSTPASPAPAGSSTVRRAVGATGEDPAAGRRRNLLISAAASLGLGLGLVGGGGLAIWIGESSARHYNDDSQCLYGSLTRDERCGDYRQIASGASVWATTFLIGGGLAIGTAGVLFVLASHHRETSTNAVSCSLGRGVVCALSF
jgi:hypothetical protein